MKEIKCPLCEGKVVFEKKKTFVYPDKKNGVCTKCGNHFVLEGQEKLIIKGGGRDAC